MRDSKLTTSIDAHPEQVWSVVADFEGYGRWHPLVERLQVDTKWSTRLSLVLRMTRRVRLRGSLIEFAPPRLVRWDGSHPLWGLLRVRYLAEISPSGACAVLDQTVKVGGLLPLLRPRVLGSMPDALAEAAYALVRDVERQQPLSRAA